MWRSALRYSAVGLEMGVAVGLGVLLGVWLDKKLGIQPWGTLGGLLLGIATGFRGLFRAATEWSREIEAEESERDEDGATGNDQQDGDDGQDGSGDARRRR